MDKILCAVMVVLIGCMVGAVIMMQRGRVSEVEKCEARGGVALLQAREGYFCANKGTAR